MKNRNYHVSYNFKNKEGAGFGDLNYSGQLETAEDYVKIKGQIAIECLNDSSSSVVIIQVRELKG